MKQGSDLDRSSTLDSKSSLKVGSRSSLKQGSRLPEKSAKRIAEDAPGGPRSIVRDTTFQRDGYRCVARHLVPGVPCSAALECDEFQGRGREPGSHLDDTKTQTLCAICHRVKTDHPRVAGLIGLYGPVEQERRLAEEPHGALDAALADFAQLKARVAGLRGAHGGDAAAARRFALERGVVLQGEAER